MAKKILVRLSIFLFLFSGCSEDFDAKGPLDKKMVIFSVLSTDREVQFVRYSQTICPQDMMRCPTVRITLSAMLQS